MSKIFCDYKHQNSKSKKYNKWLLKEEHRGLFNHSVDGMDYMM